MLQQRGASGKTTRAINLAAAAHLDGRRTLVVDMDRQASAFDSSAAREDGSPLDGLAVVKADRAMALPSFKVIGRGNHLDGPPRLGEVKQSADVAVSSSPARSTSGPWLRLSSRSTRPKPTRSASSSDTVLFGASSSRVEPHGGRHAWYARPRRSSARPAASSQALFTKRAAFPDAASRGESVLTSCARISRPTTSSVSGAP